jgi:hypothetical protein
MTTMSGVPVGAQTAWLSNSRSGCPSAVTRVAAVTHCAVTHGPLPLGGGGIAQPATTYGAVAATTGWPPTVTRGTTTVGCACPPWLHMTCAPT